MKRISLISLLATTAMAMAGCATTEETRSGVEVRMAPVVNGGPVKWLRIPTDADMLNVYPAAALSAGIGGRVRMVCTMTAAGTLADCAPSSETPPDQGFGAAAVRLGPLFRFDAGDRPDLVGQRGGVNVTFRPEGSRSPSARRRRPHHPEVHVRIRDQPYQGGPGGDVLAHLFRIDLVQRVVGRVMQVEIAGAVLVQTEHRHA